MTRRRGPRHSLPVQAMAIVLLAVTGWLIATQLIGWAR